jgi:hypothetical protein
MDSLLSVKVEVRGRRIGEARARACRRTRQQMTADTALR